MGALAQHHVLAVIGVLLLIGLLVQVALDQDLDRELLAQLGGHLADCVILSLLVLAIEGPLDQ